MNLGRVAAVHFKHRPAIAPRHCPRGRAASVGACKHHEEASSFRFPWSKCASILVAIVSGEAACITRQSTPTPKGVSALRAHLVLGAGYFYVMPHELIVVVRRLVGNSGLVGWRGRACWRRNLRAAVSRFEVREGIFLSLSEAPPESEARLSGTMGRFARTNHGVHPCPQRVVRMVLNSRCTSAWRRIRHNKSANTDPQQQEAASPQVLVVRLPLR